MEFPTHIASKLYTNAQTALRPAIAKEPPKEEQSFADMAANLINSMRENESLVKAGLVGKADAQTVVEALAATEIAVQTAVTVRDRVVEAYQEILRMPV